MESRACNIPSHRSCALETMRYEVPRKKASRPWQSYAEFHGPTSELAGTIHDEGLFDHGTWHRRCLSRQCHQGDNRSTLLSNKGNLPQSWLGYNRKRNRQQEDKMYRLRLQDVLFHFRLTQNMSYTVSQRYCSTHYLAEVFTQAGLTNSEADAIGLMNTIGLDWSHFKHLNRASGSGFGLATLGRDLHTIHNVDLGNGTNRQTMLVALIADFASFHGNAGWVWFNSMLIQGAWPWLGGYSKSYAKTVFTAMVCLFCCVRHGYIWDGVGMLILRLARKLVDPDAFSGGRIKFRGAGRLVGEKVLYEPVPKKSGDKSDSSKKFDGMKSIGKVSSSCFTKFWYRS